MHQEINWKRELKIQIPGKQKLKQSHLMWLSILFIGVTFLKTGLFSSLW